jgi:hypothetical protein
MDWAAYLQTAGDVEIQHLTCVQELAADSNRSLSWEVGNVQLLDRVISKQNMGIHHDTPMAFPNKNSCHSAPKRLGMENDPGSIRSP